ncbi:aquaporin AQPAn.G-like [Clytia hemisphaerica]|uniref:Aquaporin n=1 Tax=Clytia hemisphaerica TaxID=252671 RepID=A0A7M6DNS2_9CNID|eukprot:TCONS_00022661-protein
MPYVEIKLGANEIGTWRFWRAVLAEFLGMLLFLLCVTTVALHGTKDNQSANNVEAGLGIAFGITTLAQAFGHVSGGHLNPAVTLGLVVGGRTPIIRGFFYIAAQMVGAIAGSGITYGCTPEAARATLGVNAVAEGVRVGHAFTLEMLFTFILVFFVLSVTDPIKKVEPYGQTLGIGICIWVAHVCLIPYTNCSINPARSFGPAVIMDSWKDHWIFWIGPFVGGLVAALLYSCIFYAEEEEKYEVERQRSAIPLQNTKASA